ncbi:recombinase family protein [Kaistia sp. MMO-174]|uniref:recombinase family protein n=1 Tax=Kaistia sp. MMO-174 TaxID=3081256 RepID=UPI003FA59280
MTARRAAIYARYSTDLQSDRSIEDQERLCRDYAERKGYRVADVFFDRAKSGGSMVGRDGFARMMQAAQDGQYQVIVCEALDRISRDIEDLAGTYKRLSFAGVDLEAVHEGKADTILIGLRGLVGQLFREDGVKKVRRGLSGRVDSGLSAGGRSYGYRPVAGAPGQLEIDPVEAEIVRRIFREYAAGAPPREIAHRLNADGIAPPRGQAWTPSAMIGSKERGSGLLRNRLFEGVRVWNKVRMVRDPDSGRRISRANPESEWKVVKVPALRIVDDETFRATRARLERPRAETQHYERNHRIFSGLLRCAGCGGGMTISGHTKTGQPQISCARQREAGICDHNRRYRIDVIERTVLKGIQEQLAHPAAIEAYVEEYMAERKRLAASATRNRGSIERRLADAKGAVSRLIDAYTRGLLDIDQLAERKPALEAEVARLEDQLAAAEPVPSISLHPQALRQYHHDIKILHDRLDQDPAAVPPEVVAPMRRLVAEVRVFPSKGFEPFAIEVRGSLNALLAEAMVPFGKVALGLVAEEGLEPPTRGL